MPYNENDALDSKAFEILLKRGALETPSKPHRNILSKSESLRKRRGSIIPIEPMEAERSNKKNKTSRRIRSVKNTAKQWSEIGSHASINAMTLLNTADANVSDNLKLKRHVEKYENEMLPYLQHIGRHIRSLPRNETNFRIEESEYPKQERNRTAKNRRIKQVNSFLRKEALSPLFRSIAIRGDGNCLFNSFAWWIITYYSLTNVDFYEMNEPLSHIIPKIPRTSPLNAAKSHHIENVAKLLRSMVCGFYDIYQVAEKDLRETNLKLVSLADLNSQIVGLEPGHREKICKNAEWGTDVDARVMAYMLKVNVVFVLTNEYAGRHYYSVEYGELGRPTFYIFNSTGHYDVLYPSDLKMQGSIAPLPIVK
jgi:hypothetical protein